MKPDISPESQFLPLCHLHSTPPLGESTCRDIAMMIGVATRLWNFFWRYVYSLRHNSWMWQIHWQTLHDGIRRTCIVSSGKNVDQNATRANAALIKPPYLSLASYDLNFWLPDPIKSIVSWSCPVDLLANLHQNWLIHFHSIVFTKLVTNVRRNEWTGGKHNVPDCQSVLMEA